MSYDVFFQGFRNCDFRPGGGDVVRTILAPFVTRSEDDSNFLRVEVDNGSADAFLSDDSMMINQVEGVATLDLFARAAAAANWVILLPGGPAALTNEGQRAELPAELADEAVVISDGADLARLIASL
jgi:hypothetical protein